MTCLLSNRVRLTRRIIVETAAELADRNGLESVTLTVLADTLAVRKPSLYNHINGLSELKILLAIWGTEELTKEISAAAIGKAKREAVVSIAATYRCFAQQRPGLYQAILASPDRNNTEWHTAIKNMMAVITAIMAPYHLPEPIHAVRGLRSIMHGFIALEAAGWFAAPAEREKSYQYLIATFIDGIEAVR